MDDSEATSLEQIRAFLAGSAGCGSPDSAARRYTSGVLTAHRSCSTDLFTPRIALLLVPICDQSSHNKHNGPEAQRENQVATNLELSRFPGSQR